MLGGELIYQTSDDYGRIDVIDYMQQIRTLQFGNDIQQSACLLCKPNFLIHNYAQAMMLPLCWVNPKRILVLGLGAGSIVKFLLNTLENVIIDAVELRGAVYDIATEYFSLPEQSERLNIFIQSAQSWLDTKHKHQYDLIIVDIFLTSKTNEDPNINLRSSYQALYHLLTDKGIISINYLNADNKKNYMLAPPLSSLFHQPFYFINVEDINLIFFASKSEIPSNTNPIKLNQISEISSFSHQKYFELLKKCL